MDEEESKVEELLEITKKQICKLEELQREADDKRLSIQENINLSIQINELVKVAGDIKKYIDFELRLQKKLTMKDFRDITEV